MNMKRGLCPFLIWANCDRETKSDLMECLTKSSQPANIHPGLDAEVLDGAAIVHMVRPGAFSNILGVFSAKVSSVYHLSD